MITLLRRKVRGVSPVLLAFTALYGCGTAAKTAADAASGATAQPSPATPTAGATGGSLSLTEPAAGSGSAVTQIHISVLDEAACAAAASGPSQGGRNGGDHDGDDRRPPPPPPRRDDDRGPPQQGWAGLADATATATGSAAATATATSTATGPAQPAVCLVKDLTQAFAAGTQLSLTNIPDGSYTVLVVLEDASGTGLEEGSAAVQITSGQVASAAITLGPMPVGSINVSVQEAPASKLGFVSSTLSQAANACGVLQIQAQAPDGNGSALSAALVLNLASSAATGAFYSDSACTAAVTTVTIAAAASEGSVYYKDTAAGSPTLTAADPTASGLGAASAAGTITAP